MPRVPAALVLCLLAAPHAIIAASPDGPPPSARVAGEPQSIRSAAGTAMTTSERPAYTNRLARERSPYLLQHAHNPVDWYPWGEEAFARARAEHKPIFLSVGYSTCHWCHVMEHESFENLQIAKVLNDSYVAIKVDREERPDVDRIYMTYVQAATQSGGWPMSVWLTPDLHPFYGGTYFPPERRWGKPGLLDLLQSIAQSWKRDPATIERAAARSAEQLARLAERPGQGTRADAALLDEGFANLEREYDRHHGGFGGAPKFPQAPNLVFLLAYHRRTGHSHALQMALETLDAMARGGIHDQIGGGFHRYSTDERWHVPHFEKMLYDQAQLAALYIDAFRITGEERHAAVARDVLDYVASTMTDAAGGFHGAEDADSAPDAAHPLDRREGAYYVWTYDEVQAILGPTGMRLAAAFWGIEKEGNAGEDPQGELSGKNVLHQAHSPADAARIAGLGETAARRRIEQDRQLLLAARAHRPPPRRDDKVVTSWNGLMISAFARGAQALAEPRYHRLAARAAAFVLESLTDKATGRLLRAWRQGSAGTHAFADDYAFFIQALLDLYETDGDAHWLAEATRLQRLQVDIFYDAQTGGFYDTAHGDPSLILRPREDQDSAEPAAGSITALNLLRLFQMGGDPAWHALAERTIRTAFSRLGGMAAAAPQLLVALAWLLGDPIQIVLARPQVPGAANALLAVIHRRYLPFHVLLFADGGDGQKALASRIPFLAGVAPVGGQAAAYVCHDFRCERPTTDAAELAGLLQR